MTGFYHRVLLCLFIVSFLIGVAFPQEHSGSNAAATTASSAASQPKNPSDRVILKVGDTQITQAQFEAGFFNVGKKGDYEAENGEADTEGAAEQDRRTLGDNYASVLMLSHKAIADHLDSRPDVKRDLAMNRLQILSNAEYERLMQKAKPTPAEISKYYSAHSSEYDQVQIRRLFIWKQHEDSKGQGLSSQDAITRADTIRQQTLAGENPRKLSAELNNSDEGLLDGDPLTFPRGELPAKMEKIAFGLKPGEWGEVEDTPQRLVRIQLVKRSTRSLEEVSSLIAESLQGQKMQEMVNDLKKKAGIWMDPEYFADRGSPAANAQSSASSPASDH